MGRTFRNVVRICALTALGASACSNSRQELGTQASTAATSDDSTATDASPAGPPTTTDPTSTTSATTSAAPSTDLDATTSSVTPTTVAPTTVMPTTTVPVRHGTPGAPIVVVSGLGVLGWWDGTSWIDSDASTADIPVAAGVDFSAFSLDSDVRHTVSTGIDIGCEPSGGYTVTFEPQVFFDPDAASFAVNADWNLFPHPVEQLAADDADAIDIVRRQLVADGLASPDIRIDQLLRTDIDGDGVDETLIAASNPDFDLNVPGRAGWFSSVIIRQVIDGVARVTALNQDVHLTDDPVDQTPNNAEFGFDAVADFNGDGRSEVTVFGSFWEGALVTVYDVDPAAESPRPVLQVGCGS